MTQGGVHLRRRITAWKASLTKQQSCMTLIRKRLVRIDMSNPPPGRCDPSRMGKRNPNDTDPYPVITDDDREATRRLAAGDTRVARKIG